MQIHAIFVDDRVIALNEKAFIFTLVTQERQVYLFF